MEAYTYMYICTTISIDVCDVFMNDGMVYVKSKGMREKERDGYV